MRITVPVFYKVSTSKNHKVFSYFYSTNDVNFLKSARKLLFNDETKVQRSQEIHKIRQQPTGQIYK